MATRTAQDDAAARRARAAYATAQIDELTETRLATSILDAATAAQLWAHERQRAVIAARLAAWWRVLALVSWGQVPRVFLHAAYSARSGERARAEAARKRAQIWAGQVAAEQAAAGMPGVEPSCAGGQS